VDGEGWVWIPRVKTAINHYPSLLVEGQEYTIYSDSSKNGLGCVLMQDSKVAAYASKQLNPKRKITLSMS